MRKILVLPLVLLSVALGLAAPADASPTRVITLPGARSVEPVAAGNGTTFYAGDLFGGDIYRGDIRKGTAELFIDRPEGTQAVGLDVDKQHDLLFVAGGDDGNGYVYNTRTRALVASYKFGDKSTSFINDVVVTPFGAWFTDSLQPKLYFVPTLFGIPGPVHTLNLSGPAAGAPGHFTVNNIAATPLGNVLFVVPQDLGKLTRINPFTGASEVVTGVDVPDTDGIVVSGHEVWAAQTFDNAITRWRLNDDLTAGTLEKTIKDPANFHVPLGIAKFGDKLAVANSHFDTNYPPTSPTYEVLVVDA